MFSAVKIVCLSVMCFALCLIAEAGKTKEANGERTGHQGIQAPMEQNLFEFQFDVPFQQAAVPSTGSVVDSSSSESSEVDTDMDMDTDTDTDVDTADSPNGVANGGNQLPFQSGGVNLPNTRNRDQNRLQSGSSGAGKKTGIAFAALALIGLVVAGAVFAFRKYRPNIPFVSQV